MVGWPTMDGPNVEFVVIVRRGYRQTRWQAPRNAEGVASRAAGSGKGRGIVLVDAPEGE